VKWSKKRSLARPSDDTSKQDRKASCQVETIVLEVTQRCNNACAHCYNYWRRGNKPKEARGDLSQGEWIDLLKEILTEAPLKQVGISGGEPLLRRDLPEIVSSIMKMDLGVVVITNGTLLDRSMLKRFPKGCTFEVTLFGAEANLHDRMAGRTVFKNLIKNLSRIDAYGHGFVSANVITRLNAHDVKRTIKLGIALGAQAVMINRINLSKGVYLHRKHVVPSASQLRSSLSEVSELAANYKIPVAVSVPVPPCVADPREYPDLHFGWCPRGGNDAYYTVGNSGYLRPCNHSSVVLGDLRTQGFAEIVAGQKAKDFWASTPIECKQCHHPLKEKCLGGCPAAADECYGTANRRDPFVDLASGQAQSNFARSIADFKKENERDSFKGG